MVVSPKHLAFRADIVLKMNELELTRQFLGAGRWAASSRKRFLH